MKNRNKILASVLLATMIVGSTACAGGESAASSETTTAATTTTDLKELDNAVDWDSMSEIEAVDTENEAGTGSLYKSGEKAGTVKALCYYDLAETEHEIAGILATRFGGTIETEVCTSGSAYFEKLATKIAANDSPDIVRYDWMAYPFGTSKNMFTELDGWLDMNSPLWESEKSVIESFNYAGKHYYYPSNISTNFAMVYNKLVLEEAGMDDPMDLYFSGNWTWDTFEDMLAEWATQGEGYTPFTGGSWTSMMFANTTGTKVIDVTGDDIINNLKNENVQRTMDWLAGLKKKGYVGDGFIAPGDAFKDGKLLFLGMGLTWAFEGSQEDLFKNGIPYEMAALPFPRDPNADKYYLSADTYGFLVPAGASNIQGGIDWILSARIYETDPETVAADHAEKMDTTPVYYAKCPECKYNFTENGKDDLTTCPECGAARKQKFKAVYSEKQLEVISDMTDPEKFTLVFDNTVGFSDDFSSLFIGTEETLFDGPLYYDSSYTQLRENNYGVVESYLDPYRQAIKDAASNS